MFFLLLWWALHVGIRAEYATIARLRCHHSITPLPPVKVLAGVGRHLDPLPETAVRADECGKSD
jgi:hypothetical protein